MTTNWLIFFLEPLFAAATAIQTLVWLLLGDAGRHTTDGAPAAQDEPDPAAVSVVICARNEAHNLRRLLPKVLNQRYSGDFEVLVVNDASTDASAQVLAELAALYPHLRVLTVQKKLRPGKKGALEQGIAAARYDWLLLTDADCAPATAHWLAEMAVFFNDSSRAIVLGYAPMRPEPGLWNKWARYETAWTAMQYFTLAAIGMPYMGVGRNLAWRKALFSEVGGFAAHAHIPSGDDDLLVGAVARPDNFAVCLYPGAFVFSDAKSDLPSWIRQKKRHLGASILYRRGPNLLLGGLATMHTLHYGLGAILLCAGSPATLIWGLYAARMAVVWPVYARWLTLLREKGLRWYVPLLDGLLAVYYGAFVPFTLLGRKKGDLWGLFFCAFAIFF